MNLKTKAAIAAITFGVFVGSAAAKPSLAPSASSPDDADKIVLVKDKTKFVNVFKNEIVLFKVGDAQFALKFDGVNQEYDLAKIAPPGVVTRSIKVYVQPSARESDQGAR